MAVSPTDSDRASTSEAVPRFPSDSSDVARVSRKNETSPEIFLSHSRYQKGFVDRLYHALVNAGQSPPFYDIETIPKAVEFVEYIKRCASECKLGIVVLSNEFVTTLFPMLELELMTDLGVEIFPLFYELSLNELKDATKLSEWRRKWETMAAEDNIYDVSIDVNKWERALKSLLNWNGREFHPNTSETQYLNSIVADVSKKISPIVTFDLTNVKGERRLIQEIVERFDRVQSICPSSSHPCALGLYGVGGLGKTTLCKIMVNYYKSEYGGKSALINFPSEESSSKKSILEECKKILKRLCSVSDSLLDQVDDFDQASKLLRNRIKLHKVFLAMDNVCDHFSFYARTILKMEFAPGSKVLVTSRSDAVLRVSLRESLMVNEEHCVGRLPTVNHKEALEMLDSSSGKELSRLVSQIVLDRVLYRCFFNGFYHPLVLDAIGRILRRTNDEEMQERLGRISLKQL